MPRSQIELDEFRDEIDRRIALKHTQPEILNWLARQGAIISRNTLSTRVNAWATDRSKTPSSDAKLVSAVDTAFHTSQHSDQTIAVARSDRYRYAWMGRLKHCSIDYLREGVGFPRERNEDVQLLDLSRW